MNKITIFLLMLVSSIASFGQGDNFAVTYNNLDEMTETAFIVISRITFGSVTPSTKLTGHIAKKPSLAK